MTNRTPIDAAIDYLEDLIRDFDSGVKLPISITYEENPNGILEFHIKYVRQETP